MRISPVASYFVTYMPCMDKREASFPASTYLPVGHMLTLVPRGQFSVSLNREFAFRCSTLPTRRPSQIMSNATRAIRLHALTLAMLLVAGAMAAASDFVVLSSQTWEVSGTRSRCHLWRLCLTQRQDRRGDCSAPGHAPRQHDRPQCWRLRDRFD